MADHSSADSIELTVEDENRRNSETDDIHSILGNFMEAREESLEELVGGFMYLTMEDVRNGNNASSVTVFASTGTVSMGEDPDRPAANVQERVTVPGHSTCIKDVGNGSGGQTEDIEEEVLEECTGARRTSEDALFRHRPASLTKFDNFVMSEEDAGNDCECGAGRGEDWEEGQDEQEEDWMPTSGYMASFAAGNSTPEERAQTAEGISHLADRQMVNKSSSEIGTHSSQPTTCMLSTSVQLSAAESSLGRADTGEPSPKHVTTSRAPELDYNSSVKNYDGVNADSKELSTEPVTTSKTLELDCDSSSQVCDDDVEGPAWALNPGEAEEEMDSLPVVQNVSMIEVSTKVVASCVTAGVEGDTTSQEATKECSDEMIPFELDEDFDYNNVVYTPKFTQAEMNYLTSFMPDKS